MDPIGASRTWEWHGYRNSWVEIDGQQMQSVSGGAHWDGGFWVSAEDLARLGLLYARNGEWQGRQVLSREWIQEATQPVPIRGNYGFLWWLNADLERRVSKASPASAYYMAGGGGYFCWVDPENDLVIVVKNLGGTQQTLGEFVDRVMASVQPM
jgi:CubicO group peptidase (beta-lactamase class C family)